MATYYVSTTGDNGNDGSYEFPWRDIQYGVDQLQAGDTLYVRGGTYTESPNITCTGSEALPITVARYQSEAVTVNATTWYCVRFQYATWVTLDGFILRGGTSHCVFITGSTYNTVRYCDIAQGGWAGVMFGGENGSAEYNTIQYNVVHDNDAEGIYLRSGPSGSPGIEMRYNVIEYNTVYDNGAEGIQNTFTFEQPSPNYTVIRGNDVYNNADWGGGICLTGTGLLIERNRVHHNGGPVGGLWGEGVTDSTIRNNLFYKGAGTDSSWRGGIVLYQCSGVDVYHNVAYLNVGTGILISSDGGTSEVRNNICADNGDQINSSVTPVRNMIDGPCSTPGTNPLYATPAFTDPNTDNYYPLSSCPSIDAGDNIGVVTDFDGNGRPYPVGGDYDIGAYEWRPAAPPDFPQYVGDVRIVDDLDTEFSTAYVQDDWEHYEDPGGEHYAGHHHYNPLIGAGDDTATWALPIILSGSFQISMWWWAGAGRPPDVPVTIVHAGGQTVVYVDQTVNGGQWNTLGTWTFDDEVRVIVSDAGSSGADTVADAIRVEFMGGAWEQSLAGAWSGTGGVLKRATRALAGLWAGVGDVARQFFSGSQQYFQDVAGSWSGAGTVTPWQSAPPLFSSGFETGDFSEWTRTTTSGTGVASVQDVVVRNGLYAGRFQTTSGADGDCAYAEQDIAWPAGDVAYYAAWARVAAGSWDYGTGIGNFPLMVAANQAPYWGQLAGIGVVGAALSPDRPLLRLCYRRRSDNGWQTVAPDTAIMPGTWYRLVLKVDLSGANPVYTWWLDGAQIASEEDTTVGTIGVPSSARFGNDLANWDADNYGDWYADDCLVSETDPGEMGVYGTGAVAAPPAQIAATGVVGEGGITGTGAVTAQPAAIAGTGIVSGEGITGTGAVAAQPAAIAGTGTAGTGGLPPGRPGTVGIGHVIGKGTLALDYGVSGNGLYEVNAIDGQMAENSPYAQIVTWTVHPYDGSALQARLGNLRGIFNVADEYGLYAGEGITDADQFLRISNVTIEGHNLPVKLYDGANVAVALTPGTNPSIAIGTPIPTGWMSESGWWAGRHTDGTYRQYVGVVSGGDITAGWKWDSTLLTVRGAVLIQAGSSGIANLSDAGDLAVQDSVALDTQVTDGSTYKRTTTNEKTGAGRAYGALDSANVLTTAVDPTTAWGADPGATGLFLGSDYMGYFNNSINAWAAYIGNNGHFLFSDNTASPTRYIAWNGTDLYVNEVNLTITDGAFNLRSASSGTRIEITSAHVAGYNGTTLQFELRASDGAAICAGGGVEFSDEGIVVHDEYGEHHLTFYNTVISGVTNPYAGLRLDEGAVGDGCFDLYYHWESGATAYMIDTFMGRRGQQHGEWGVGFFNTDDDWFFALTLRRTSISLNAATTVDANLVVTGNLNLSAVASTALFNGKILVGHGTDYNPKIQATGGLLLRAAGYVAPASTYGLHMFCDSGYSAYIQNGWFDSGGNLTRYPLVLQGDVIVLGANANDYVRPETNETTSLGADNFEWKEVWALDTSINHSDARDKLDIVEAPGLALIRELRPVGWRWDRPGAVGRHHGLIGQEVLAALTRLGIAPDDFAGYVYSANTEKHYLRYAEFIAPLIRAAQELDARLAALEAAGG